MKEYLLTAIDTPTIKILLIITSLDVLFGILRAAKEREWNSTIGINGLIRKTGMISAALIIGLIDRICGVNFIGFMPQDILEYLPIQQIGIASFFCVLYIIFEALSVLKNMYKCGIPIPKKLERVLKRLLKDFTSEITEEEKTCNTQ